MLLRYRLAGALLATAVLAAGCGGVAPESGGSTKASAPAAQTAPATATTVTPSPAPAGQQTAPATQQTAPAAPKPADQPVATAPTTPVAAAPVNPTNPATAAPAPAPVQTLSFTTLQKGAYSGVTERKAALVTDEASWRANWAQLNARMMPVPEAPAMDFSSQGVLIVYMGERNTGGYSIEITGVELSGTTLKVNVKQTAPGPGAIVTQALTQPFHMIRIPKVPAGTKVEVNW